MHELTTPTGNVIHARDMKCIVDDTGIALRSNRSIWQHSGTTWVRYVQVLAVVAAAVVAYIVATLTHSAGLAFTTFFAFAFGVVVVAAYVDAVAIRRATDTFIPAASIQRIDASQFGTTSIFTIQLARHEGVNQQQILIDNPLGTQMDGNAARELFRVHGWMPGKCNACGYYLLPKQITCSECGASATDCAR